MNVGNPYGENQACPLAGKAVAQAGELLPQSAITLLATRCHLSLHALRTGRGSASTVRTLLEVIIVAGVLSARRFEHVCAKSLRDAELAITRTVVKGVDVGHWMLTEDQLRAVSKVVGTFEQQMESPSIGEIEAAFEHAKAIEFIEC
ncbi:hypothetical protein RVY52_004103 [Burkholderia cenocepacia]|nr:hypothetical protein [Burkholderia cenocepacia]